MITTTLHLYPFIFSITAIIIGILLIFGALLRKPVWGWKASLVSAILVTLLGMGGFIINTVKGFPLVEVNVSTVQK